MREMDERYVAHFAQIHAVLMRMLATCMWRDFESLLQLQRPRRSARCSNLQTNYHLRGTRHPRAKLSEFDGSSTPKTTLLCR